MHQNQNSGFNNLRPVQISLMCEVTFGVVIQP